MLADQRSVGKKFCLFSDVNAAEMFGYKTIPLIQISELLCDVSYKVERSINLLKLILDITVLFLMRHFLFANILQNSILEK